MAGPITDKLIFRVDNLVDPAIRAAWIDLLRDIFDLDLAEFSALNIWNERYRAFSYLDGDVIVANVGCYPVSLRLGSEKVSVGHLLSVATRPAFRRRGLFNNLMQRVLAFASTCYDCLILYTNTPALYEPQGFRILEEHFFRGRLRASTGDRVPVETRLLSVRDPTDLTLIRSLFARREPLSNRLAVLGNDGVFIADALMAPDWQLSYLPKGDALVVWQRDKATKQVKLLDIVAAALPGMDQLVAVLGLVAPDEEIDVLFPPDRLTGDFTAIPLRRDDGDVLMVRGPFPISSQPFMLPLTAYA